MEQQLPGDQGVLGVGRGDHDQQDKAAMLADQLPLPAVDQSQRVAWGRVSGSCWGPRRDLIRSFARIDPGHPGIADLLHSSFEFGIFRNDHGEAVRAASGAALEAIAGDWAGGTLFLCHDEDGRRPVVFASSGGTQ